MSYPSSELVIDPVLIRKYDVNGPRYTSYPTADRFVEAFGEAAFRHALATRNIGGVTQPLSLDVHVPFCSDTGYCACDKEAARDRATASRYVEYLGHEAGLAAKATDGGRRIVQMHWGCGIPIFLGREDLCNLLDMLDSHFERGPDCECSIEVNPCDIAAGDMGFLAGLGFNRVSVGVRDFDPSVQEAVHRIQPEEMARQVVGEAREAGFRSINLELIYGLPRQTLDSFNATLDKVLKLDPDRIALYSYAHLPLKFKPRQVVEAQLPSAEANLQILTLAIGRLTRAGYLYIGMDHFAKPNDDLAVAQRQGRLHRNFQGYTTHPECDMLGFGVSAISRMGATYSQNLKVLDDYYAALDADRLPVGTGLALTRDDLMRRAVIQALICQFRLSVESFESAYLIDFRDYFSRELEELKRLEEDGLVEVQPEWIVITSKGRLLVRIVCMAFDRYLREGRHTAGFSRVL
ncbi:MAG TPA: oxygen-independent coproporphyrinogen III oxidase [Burkholderiales bacterium]